MFKKSNIAYFWALIFIVMSISCSPSRNANETVTKPIGTNEIPMSLTLDSTVALLNGSWVDDIRFLKSSYVREKHYSWGMGKTLGADSFDFDVDRKLFKRPISGSYKILSISKTDKNTVRVEAMIADAEKTNKESGGTPADLDRYKVHIEFHLVDANTFWFYCPEWKDEDPMGPDAKWYRLSGPAKP
jgi:hypothetical protein